jgi:tRNA pseudouridine55 synthase
MRSVAHDLGQKLGCGAHLASLRRTAAAEFTLNDAHTLQQLEASVQQGSVRSVAGTTNATVFETMFVHPRKLVPQLPCVTANEESAALIRSGRAVNLPEMSRSPQVKVFYGQRDLIAIATRIAGTLFHPGIVLSGPGD